MLHIMTLITRTGTGLQYLDTSQRARTAVRIHPSHQPPPMKSMPEHVTAKRYDTLINTADF